MKALTQQRREDRAREFSTIIIYPKINMINYKREDKLEKKFKTYNGK